ncbi:uncharacterized protein LOC111254723 isoform X3 [Varroa destructor]|uniref:EGF-like domain-containing protein n=1 Tax=Varroa destructor TaxID=109461 RepID=A0A7M7KVT6_VARDE|nr:uncharacterized protein LOC111254723 isoform X3 [Varroa destructor]
MWLFRGLDMRQFMSSVVLVAACLLAMSCAMITAGRIDGSVLLTNPTSAPVPETEAVAAAAERSYVNTEKLVQQSARQIEEVVEQSEGRSDFKISPSSLQSQLDSTHTEAPTTTLEKDNTRVAEGGTAAGAGVLSTTSSTSSINPVIQTTTEATKPMKDKISMYAKKASKFSEKKTLFTKKAVTDKEDKLVITTAATAEISSAAGVTTVGSAHLTSDDSHVSPKTTGPDSSAARSSTTTDSMIATTIMVMPNSSTISTLHVENKQLLVTNEDDDEVGPGCTSKIRLSAGFKLWRSKDKNKLNLTLATDNLSCSISSGLSVSSNTTSHLVLDAQVGDQIRLFVDELDEGTVVTLHRSEEEALTECVEPPHGSIVWNATRAEQFVIQANLLTQSGLQFFAVAVQSSSVLRVWHIRISVYDSECESRRDSEDLCSERGVCALAPGEGTYTCHCCPGVKGRTCDELDACSTSPCRNNGFCVDISEGLHGSLYQCLCPHAFRGANCEQNADFCEMHHPCKNNATCTSTPANASTGLPEYTCQCQKGFEGPNCEVNIDECESKPCVHGMCEDGVGEFKCYCLPGYGGELCEFEYDECDSSPCVNNGACEDLIAGYKCHCGPGYTGRRCEIKVDLCEPNPCAAPATCIDRGNNYTCVCRGSGCATRDELDPCYPNPCQHGGSCWPSMDTFYCSCPPGFAGDNCEEIAYPQAIAERRVYNPDDNRRPSSERLHTIYVACATLAGACALVAIAVTVCQCRLGRLSSPDHLTADCERLKDDGASGHLADEDPLFPETSSAFLGNASRLQHLIGDQCIHSKHFQHQQSLQQRIYSSDMPIDSMRTPLLFPEPADHGHY